VKKLLFLFFIGFATFAFGQRGWEAGGMIGGAHYFGDLNTSVDLSSPGGMAGLEVPMIQNPKTSSSKRET